MTQMIPVTARSSPPGRASLVRQKSRRVAAQHCVGARRRVCVCVCVCVCACACAFERISAQGHDRALRHRSRQSLLVCVVHACVRDGALRACVPFSSGNHTPFLDANPSSKILPKAARNSSHENSAPGTDASHGGTTTCHSFIISACACPVVAPPKILFVYRGKRREDQSCSTLDTQTFRNTETSRCTGGRNAGPGRDYRPSAAEAQWHADRSSRSFSLLPLHHQACVSQQTPPPNVLHA